MTNEAVNEAEIGIKIQEGNKFDSFQIYILRLYKRPQFVLKIYILPVSWTLQISWYPETT